MMTTRQVAMCTGNHLLRRGLYICRTLLWLHNRFYEATNDIPRQSGCRPQPESDVDQSYPVSTIPDPICEEVVFLDLHQVLITNLFSDPTLLYVVFLSSYL